MNSENMSSNVSSMRHSVLSPDETLKFDAQRSIFFFDEL